MSEENSKVIDTEITNEETVDEQELQEEVTLTREDIDNIMETLKDHKLHIENLYEKVEGKKSLINLGDIDPGVVKWIAIGVIGVALSKNGGAFGLDIPFFHIRIGSNK